MLLVLLLDNLAVTQKGNHNNNNNKNKNWFVQVRKVCDQTDQSENPGEPIVASVALHIVS